MGFIRHTGGAAWGVGLLVGERAGQRTYVFLDGVARTFKAEVVARFVQPAEPPSPEDAARLQRARSAGGVAMPIAVDLALEEQIGADPDHAEVYADFLQKHRDPRGELIAMQAKRARDPDDAKLRAAEAALLAKHGVYFVPEALQQALKAPRRAGDDALARCEVEWRMGYIVRARLARKLNVKLDLAAVTAQLVGHPSALFLRELVLGVLGEPDRYDYTPLVSAVVAASPRWLDSLVIGDFGLQHIERRYVQIGELSRVIAALPSLRRLVVQGGATVSTSPASASLRELRVVADLPPVDRDRLCAARLPELVTLELDGATTTDIATLEANGTLGNVRQLVLRSASREVVDALAGTRLLARLDTLVAPGVDVADAQLTEAAVLRLTNEPRNAAAAREVADVSKWGLRGRHGDRLWGEYEGRGHDRHYSVFAQVDGRRTGCSCGSMRNPCKHALALLLLAARGEAFDERTPPEGLMRHASVERPRYAPVWE